MSDWFSDNGVTGHTIQDAPPGQFGTGQASLPMAGGGINLTGASGTPATGTPGTYQPGSPNDPMTLASMARPTNTGYSLDPGTGQGSLLNGFTDQFRGVGDVTNTPGYKFALQQGNNSIQNSAAARGNLLSGQTLADMASFDTGLASQTYQQQYQNAQQEYANAFNIYNTNSNNSYNRLAGMASLGQNAASTTGNQGVATGANVGNTYGNIGNANAAGTVGGANAWTGGLGNISGMAQQGAIVNAMYPRSTATATTPYDNSSMWQPGS